VLAPGLVGKLGGGVNVSIVIAGVGDEVGASVAGGAVTGGTVGMTIGGRLKGAGVVTPSDGAADAPVGTAV